VLRNPETGTSFPEGHGTSQPNEDKSCQEPTVSLRVKVDFLNPFLFHFLFFTFVLFFLCLPVGDLNCQQILRFLVLLIMIECCTLNGQRYNKEGYFSR